MYQLNITLVTRDNHLVKLHRNGKLLTIARGRTKADAVREVVRTARACRRGGMFTLSR